MDGAPTVQSVQFAGEIRIEQIINRIENRTKDLSASEFECPVESHRPRRDAVCGHNDSNENRKERQIFQLKQKNNSSQSRDTRAKFS